jgi:hypothetical protein
LVDSKKHITFAAQISNDLLMIIMKYNSDELAVRVFETLARVKSNEHPLLNETNDPVDEMAKPKPILHYAVDSSKLYADAYNQLTATMSRLLDTRDLLILHLQEENERLRNENSRISILEDRIKFLENHPTTVNNFYAPYYEADKIEKHTDIEVGSQNISNGGIGINYSKPTPMPQAASATFAPQPPTSSEESASSTTQKICCFIIKGAADRIYSCDDQEFNERLRAATRGGAKDLVDYLIRHENMKIMDFLGNKAKGIYNELTACFGTLGYQYQMFQRECSYRNWKVG